MTMGSVCLEQACRFANGFSHRCVVSKGFVPGKSEKYTGCSFAHHAHPFHCNMDRVLGVTCVYMTHAHKTLESTLAHFVSDKQKTLHADEAEAIMQAFSAVCAELFADQSMVHKNAVIRGVARTDRLIDYMWECKVAESTISPVVSTVMGPFSKSSSVGQSGGGVKLTPDGRNLLMHVFVPARVSMKSLSSASKNKRKLP